MLRWGDQARPHLDVDDLRLARRLERPHRADRRQRRIVAKRGDARNAEQRLATNASGAVQLPGRLDTAHRALDRTELLQALVWKRDSALDRQRRPRVPRRAAPEGPAVYVEVGGNLEAVVGVRGLVTNTPGERVPRPPPRRAVARRDEVGEAARIAIRKIEPDENPLASRHHLLQQLAYALRGVVSSARILGRRSVLAQPDAVRAALRFARGAPVDRDVSVEEAHHGSVRSDRGGSRRLLLGRGGTVPRRPVSALGRPDHAASRPGRHALPRPHRAGRVRIPELRRAARQRDPRRSQAATRLHRTAALRDARDPRRDRLRARGRRRGLPALLRRDRADRHRRRLLPRAPRDAARRDDRSDRAASRGDRHGGLAVARERGAVQARRDVAGGVGSPRGGERRMCWSSNWEERELLKDEERRKDDERRTVEITPEHEVTEPERAPEPERELIRI